MADVILDGCRPTPIAHYLKALGVFRLIAQQADPNVRARWDQDKFVLQTTLSKDDILSFFLEAYVPTPVASPWNGGSGYKDSTKKDGPSLIENTTCERFHVYRQTIQQAREVRRRLGITEDVDKGVKAKLVATLRATWPDPALDWLDAVVNIDAEEGELTYPPLFGTGANDGNFDFSINFIQRLFNVFDANGQPLLEARRLLESALFGEPAPGLRDVAIGQFNPGGAGGVNSTIGTKGSSQTNPWDYILNFEGAVMFTAAMSRRQGVVGRSVLTAPFTFRVSEAGSGSGPRGESHRDELWMPLWSAASHFGEIRWLISEGRIQLGSKVARDAMDVIRALASLGVDRGISAFQRHAILERNGLSYFVTPLNRIEVRRRPAADLVSEIDGWLNTFRQSARGDRTPGSVSRLARKLDDALWDLCEFGRPEDVLNALVVLGSVDSTVLRSRKWLSGDMNRLQPVPALSGDWLKALHFASAEMRLALSLASVSGRYFVGDGGPRVVSIRENVSAVIRRGRRYEWAKESSREDAWTPGDLTRSLTDIFERRLLYRTEDNGYADRGVVSASLADIAAFLEGPFDDVAFERYFRAFLLIDWSNIAKASVDSLWARTADADLQPDGVYTLLKSAYAGHPVNGQHITVQPNIYRRAASGDGLRATELAIRRLRSSGVSPYLKTPVPIAGFRVQRIAASLLFPLDSFTSARLLQRAGAMEESNVSV